MSKIVTREEFDQVVEALWSEMEYINNLPRRTDDEAKDVAGFLTLLRRYLRKVEDDWADNAGELQADTNTYQVPDALHGLRKIAGIAIRGMIYNGIRSR